MVYQIQLIAALQHMQQRINPSERGAQPCPILFRQDQRVDVIAWLHSGGK